MGHGGLASGAEEKSLRGYHCNRGSRVSMWWIVLASQAVCLRGEWSEQWGTGICMLQKSEDDVFVSFNDNGENRAAGAASGKCVPEGVMGCRVSMLHLGLFPKADLMKKNSAGKKEMHIQREMLLLLEGLRAQRGGRMGWSSEVFPHFWLIGQVQAGGPAKIIDELSCGDL